MPEYKVSWEWIEKYYVIVDADSPEQALEMVEMSYWDFHSHKEETDARNFEVKEADEDEI